MTKAQQEKTDMIKEIVSKIPFNYEIWSDDEVAEKRQWFEDEISLVYQLGKLHQWKMNPEP